MDYGKYLMGFGKTGALYGFIAGVMMLLFSFVAPSWTGIYFGWIADMMMTLPITPWLYLIYAPIVGTLLWLVLGIVLMIFGMISKALKLTQHVKLDCTPTIWKLWLFPMLVAFILGVAVDWWLFSITLITAIVAYAALYLLKWKFPEPSGR